MTHNNILLLFAFSLFALCANAEESALLTRFDDQYEKLVSQIEQREGSAAELNQVKAIWLSTHQQLIAINAKIDAKKLDVSVTSGDRQAQAVDELIALGGAREHTLIDGIEQLDRVKKGEAVAASRNGVTASAGVGLSGQKGSGGKSGSVSISIEPEDIGTSGLP